MHVSGENRLFTKGKIKLLFGLLVGGALVAFIACGGDDEPAQPQIVIQTVIVTEPGDTVEVVVTATPAPVGPLAPANITDIAPGVYSGEIVMPVAAVGSLSGLVSRARGGTPPGVGEYLFVMGDDGSAMSPYLATGWEVSSDGLKATIKLRKGIKIWPSKDVEADFPDGWEFKAYDIAWWLNEMNPFVNPDSQHGSGPNFANAFGKATVIDDYTFELAMRSPIIAFLPLTEFGIGGSSSPFEMGQVFDAIGEERMIANPIGTGAYRLVEHVTDERTIVEAVPHWQDGIAHPKNRVQRFTQIQVPEQTSRIAMLNSGQADLSQIDFKLIEEIEKDGLQFINTMPGPTPGSFGYVGASVLFHGNLWESNHGLTGVELQVYDEPPLREDFPWIGNAFPELAVYEDTNNPPGMSDMEQARLVRWAMSYAIDRDGINETLFLGRGTPIYTEYMGVDYPGWDPNRSVTKAQVDGFMSNFFDCTDCSTFDIDSPIASEEWPWLIPTSNSKAEELLDLAGYPRGSNGIRFETTLNVYAAELGEVTLAVADAIASMWDDIGIKTAILQESYGQVIHPRIRLRDQINPTIKNGEVHSNDWPLDFWMPPTDTSLSRPGWGPFESEYLVRNHLELRATGDQQKRIQMHFDAIDWMYYWHQYAGIGQVPKGVAASQRIESWIGRRAHYQNFPPPNSNPALIVLR